MHPPLSDAEDIFIVWNVEPWLLPDLGGLLSSEILTALVVETVHRIYALACHKAIVQVYTLSIQPRTEIEHTTQ